MDNPDKPFSELVNIMRSWIPRISEPPNVSRDFWMPDHSCRVCYDCDSQFTIFNRRHHCRLCGRIFCGKCTTNSIPVLYDYNKNSQEEVERIRVCNFCFKQCKQDIAQADTSTKPFLSPSISMTSFMSTKSGGTVNNNAPIAGSYLVGPHKSIQYGSSPSLEQSLDACFEKSDAHSSRRNMNSIPNTRDQQYEYGMNRSDDDDEYGIYRDSEEQCFQPSDGYYDQVEYGEADQGYHSNKMYLAEESISSKETCTPEHTNTDSHPSMGANKMEGELEVDNDYECDASSPLYSIENADAEPVDFENNGLIWLPPDPEDEEDEREAFDDEDDDNVVGEWAAYDRSSNSFGSGELHGKDRSFEENKKAMKTVVDGHFKALISQLLNVEKLSQGEENDKRNWLEIVTSLSWEAATLLKPDTSKGGGMDPGGYVKIKCLASGHCSESKVVKGVVCKKNVAHRHMTSQFEKPRFLILGGALEYQRVTNLLSSFDTLLRQEMDHLKMAVARISAHKPNVLLVEKSVSRYAQECLLTKGISLVLNIKRPLLERIARCTGAQIIPSIDHLSSPKFGRCDLFHVDKFFEEHVSTGKTGKRTTKTLMFFEDCPKPLGCTVLLKGASLDELKKVKHVVQYGVFAAYHLALETSFLADEGASLPELPLRSPITVALPDKPSSTDKSISVVPDFTHRDGNENQIVIGTQRSNAEDNFSLRYGTIMTEAPHGDSKFLAPSSGIKVSPMGKSNHDDHITIASNKTPLSTIEVFPNSCLLSRNIKKSKVCFGEFHETAAYLPNADPNHSIRPIIDNFESSEKGNVVAAKTNDNHMVEKQPPYSNLDMPYHDVNDGNDHTSLKEGFASSSDHQSILVSMSTRSVWKGTVCERSQLFRIKYYGNFDKPLGRFLRDHLFDQSFKCQTCDSPSEAHVHSYTHHQGSLTISVRNLQDFSLPGERDGKIWMWHRCLLCPRSNGFPPATQRVVMSDAAWGLSFGKFLELSFSNHASASRVASCGHSLHRDCLRFYGYANMVACFRYAAIDVFSAYLPPPKVDFDYQQQEWIQKEANEVSGRAKFLFSQLRAALCQFIDKIQNGKGEALELRKHVVELEELLLKEKLEFEDSLHKLLKREMRKGQPVVDILEVNKLRRQVVFHTYVWYQRMSLLVESDVCPKELFNTFMTREKETIYSSEKDFHSPNVVPVNTNSNELLKDGVHGISHMDSLVDHGLERRDEELDSSQGKERKTTLYTSTSASEQSISLGFGLVGRRTLSDGQVPVMASLSDTFDAKWTGDSTPVMADLSMIDQLEHSATMPLLNDPEERIGAEVTQSFASILLSKLGDSAEDISSRFGTPLLNIYRSINKNWGSTSKFNDPSDCNSVFSFLIQELEHQGGARFLLPIGINDIVIPIYDDEPTSIISFALVSPDYHCQLSEEPERMKDMTESSLSMPLYEAGNFLSQSFDEISFDPFRSFGSNEDSTLSLSGSRGSQAIDPLTYTKSMHVRVSFMDEGPLGKIKYNVTCYYAKCFDALRRSCCPSEMDFIRSLSRCKKWGAQGGKSNVFFAKSLDDRFIIKQVTKTELESFIKFAPKYFKYLSDSITTGSPTCLAKILGIYQVTSKTLRGGKDLKMDVLVMENLLFRRNITRLYDLKGSSRSRYNPDSSGNNKVLLDQNLIEAMPTSPIFVGNKAKRLLERAVWNDTSFLASIDVMDYSLLVGIDEEKHELVLGIIDFMRQYTWDKHLETWVKASGILGGPKNVSPTVISPKQYKRRFRKAMSAYFLVVPDQWPSSVPSKMQAEDFGNSQQDSSVKD